MRTPLIHINVSGAYCSVALLLAISTSPCNAYIATSEGNHLREGSDSLRSRFQFARISKRRISPLVFSLSLYLILFFHVESRLNRVFIALAVIIQIDSRGFLTRNRTEIANCLVRRAIAKLTLLSFSLLAGYRDKTRGIPLRDKKKKLLDLTTASLQREIEL